MCIDIRTKKNIFQKCLLQKFLQEHCTWYKKTTQHPSPEGKAFPFSLEIPLIICIKETNLRTMTLIEATS